MQELSMNILDVAQNSVKAGATLVEIELVRNANTNLQTLCIRDNGCGMDEKTAKKVVDPFYTTPTTRKVGLGVPFLKMAAEMSGGHFSLQSVEGQGTCIEASFLLDSIDLAPLGDVAGTMAALVQGSPDIDFIYTFAQNNQHFCFDTRQVREILGDISLAQPQVVVFIRDYITEGMLEFK